MLSSALFQFLHGTGAELRQSDPAIVACWASDCSVTTAATGRPKRAAKGPRDLPIGRNAEPHTAPHPQRSWTLRRPTKPGAVDPEVTLERAA